MILDNYPRSAPRRRLGPSSHDAIDLARLIAEGRLRSDIAVTCRGRRDGAGQQAIAVIKAMMLARYAGCRYLHSPFDRMAHAEGAPEAWAARWERFFNFGEGEALVPTDAELIPLSAAIEIPEAYADRPVVISGALFGVPKEAIPAGEQLRSELRARYWRSSKAAIPSHRTAAGITVAIHLRRGDVNAETNRRRYVPDETLLRDLEQLKRALAPFHQTLTLNLYSEGEADDFGDFAEAGCNLHIGGDHFETLHNMVTADILLGAPSNFSYIAGFLARGIVLDHRRAVPGFSGWLRRAGNRGIHVKRLRRALLARIGLPARCAYHVRRLVGL
jgi:hypothetical protein